MGAAAELFVRVTADLKGLVSGFDDAAGAADGLGKKTDTLSGRWVDANGRMRDANGRFIKSNEQVGGSVSNLRDIIAGTAVGELLADGIRSTTSAMVGLGTQSIKLAGELEQNRVAFTTMLGSAEKADTFLRDLASFAANTPFELRGLTDSSKRLLAFGFDAQAILPIMNSVGNAVAAVGGGKETIDGVTLALGQMAAKGKVSAEEMNQLAERGIPAWKMLADGIGVSVPEAMKKAEKGGIDANTAIVALVNGMNTKFPGMMAKQSQTIMGALSNLQDSADAALTRIGERLVKTFDLTRVVQALSAAVSNLTAAFTTGGLLGVLDRAFGPTTKAAILGLGVAITASMIPAITAAAGSLVATATAAAPFVALAAAVAFAAYPIIKNWGEIRGTITALWDTAAQYTAAYYNRAVQVAGNLANLFRTAFTYIGDAIRSVLGDDLTNKLLGGIGRAVGAFKGFGTMAVAPLRAVASVGAAAASNFAETWRGAMSMSQGFTSNLFQQATATTRDFGKKLTADMLGIGKAAAAAAGGATKAASAIKAKAAEAKRAAAEVAKLEAQTERLFNVYMKQEAATQALGARLREVDVQQAKLGNTFDVAGARAEAYKDSVAELKSAFGAFSPQAIKAQQELDRFRLASENGGAATAKAFGTIAESTASLDLAREKAKVLGTTWDETSEALKAAQDAMGRLIEQGVKPGNEAYDKQLKVLRDLEAQQAKQPKSIEDIGNAMTGLTSAVEKLGGTFVDLTKLLGVEIPQGVQDMGKAIVTGVAVMGTMALAIYGVTVAWKAFETSVLTSPLGWVLTGVGVVLGIIAGAVAYFTSQQERANAEREKAVEIAKKQIEAELTFAAQWDETSLQIEAASKRASEAFGGIKSAAATAVKQATLEFAAGVSGWADNLRNSIKQAIFNGMVDALVSKALLGKFDDLIGQIVNSFESSVNGGTEALVSKLVGELEKTAVSVAGVAEKVAGALGFVPGEFQKMATEAVTKAKSAASSSGDMAGRNREAMASYHQNMLASVQRLLDKGAADPKSRLHNQYLLSLDEANKAARDLRGMATGGLVTGPTIARMGEGGRDEAVLPLNENVYRQIGQGIAAARGGSGTTLVVNYTGSGKWTREDAQGLGRLLVSELRSMGVRA